jgi:predicted branched-subunit amino acid permease
MAGERGMAWLQAFLMSAFVFSGTAQLAVLQGWTASAAVLPLMATIFVINARYLLYGASLQPWLSAASRPQALATLFVLGDSNWALSMREYHAGYRDAGFIFGSGLATLLPWLVGTLAGHLLGDSLADPARFGLDFILVAFAAAIGMAVWRGKADMWPAIIAMLVALALHRWLQGAWYIVGAGLAAGLVGALRHAD